jgi:DNA-binding SARP family transcriptional activator
MPELRLNLLGSPEVYLGDRTLSFPTRKTLALLIYLALEAGQQPREHLGTLLWPESSPERSHASLRNTLSHLQSALRQTGEEADNNFLVVTHTTLALNPDANITIDLHSVEQAYMLARTERSNRNTPEGSASAPLLRTAADRHRGDFLVGFSLSDAPAFDDWATNQREVWRRRLGLIFDRLSELQFAQGDLASTAETASNWLTLDPLNEVAYRRKMRAHFAAGERGQALETYELCCSVLMSELGIAPARDTEALAERIRTQQPLKIAESEHSRLNTPVVFLERLFGGRRDEHLVLVDHYRRTVQGQSQVVVLRGEAGIGKTRLATEFLGWAGAQEAKVLQGRAFENGSFTSYQPLMEAIRPVMERDSRAAHGINETWIASLSQPVLGEPDQAPVAPPEFEIERSRLFEALVQLTLAESERSPLILFVDDLQWADRATLDWLLYAVRRWQETSASVFLLVSLRSEALQPSTLSNEPILIDWLAQAAREVELYHLELHPLSETDAVRMILSVLSPPDSDFAGWVFSETHGHPFYLMETLKDLLERRALHPKQYRDNQWVFEVDAEHDLGQAVRVPSTVRAVIRSRLSRLSPNAFTLLAAAAILEQRLTFEHLCTIANISQDVGLSALDEVVSGRLLWEARQSDSASMYDFANDMIRDVVYTEAGDARRRLFHQRAMDLLELSKDSAAVLAHHAVAAGLAEAAFLHSLTAGQEALRLAAASEAQVHLEKARQLADEGSLTSIESRSHIRDLYLRLSEAYEMSGQSEKAQSVIDELQRLSLQ